MQYNNGDLIIEKWGSKLIQAARNCKERTGSCKKLGLVWPTDNAFQVIKDRAEKLGFISGKTIVFIIENKHTFLLAKLKYEI